MLKTWKKAVSLVLVFAMSMMVCVPAFAAKKSKINPDEIYASYVPELAELSQKNIEALSKVQMDNLFEKAFKVSSSNFTENKVHLALKNLAIAYKVEKFTSFSTNALQSSSSTTGKLSSYSGYEGVSWVRDTSSGKSPLSLSEILSGTYTLEVDYLTRSYVEAMLATSASYSVFEDFVNLSIQEASVTAIGALVGKILGESISAGEAGAVAMAVDLAVNLGWDYLQKIDRSNMYDCYEYMPKSDLMKVQFTWTNNSVTKSYSKCSVTHHPRSDGSYIYYDIPNPFPGTYGTWRPDETGYLYNY